MELHKLPSNRVASAFIGIENVCVPAADHASVQSSFSSKLIEMTVRKRHCFRERTRKPEKKALLMPRFRCNGRFEYGTTAINKKINMGGVSICVKSSLIPRPSANALTNTLLETKQPFTNFLVIVNHPRRFPWASRFGHSGS